MTSKERVGANIKHWRLLKGLTQEDLGEKVGADGPRIGRLEKGTENPTIETLDRLADILDIDISALHAPRPEEGNEHADDRTGGNTVLERLIAEASTKTGSMQSAVAEAIAILAAALKREGDRSTTDSVSPPTRRGTASGS